jgi:hypothetical protein
VDGAIGSNLQIGANEPGTVLIDEGDHRFTPTAPEGEQMTAQRIVLQNFLYPKRSTTKP